MLSTPFGERLRELAADPTHKVWVDVGCGDGQGTTNCIMQGLFSRDEWRDSNVICIESDRTQWALCKKHWEVSWRAPEKLPMHILHARLNATIDEPPASENTIYDKDQLNFAKTRLVHLRRADAVVLDVGAHSMRHAWDAIAPLNPAVVCLLDAASDPILERFPASEWNGQFFNADAGRIGLVLERRPEFR